MGSPDKQVYSHIGWNELIFITLLENDCVSGMSYQ